VHTAGQALAAEADVADAEAVRQAASKIEAELGEIGVWVNVGFAGSLAFAWDTSMTSTSAAPASNRSFGSRAPRIRS
jgi:NAD(P)-dependent dehydrogenase (short-subunit alcohol dehydrogenase family)